MRYLAGFIGLGNMGMPMAANMLRKFGSFIVYNRSRGKSELLAQEGAAIADDLGAMAEATDLIFLCLPGPKQVAEIVPQLLAHGKPGLLIVDFSTIAPADSQRMYAMAVERGMNYIDIPVSGGGAGAAKGALSLMIGATEAEISDLNLMPWLETIANKFYYMDNRGSGSAIKIINNYMAFTAQVINGEALLMADRLGISVDKFYDVTTHSSGNNMILGAKMNKVKQGDLTPGFATDLVLKDLELARQLCQDGSIPNFTLNTGIQFYRMAQLLGHGKDDSSSVIQVIREINAPKAE